MHQSILDSGVKEDAKRAEKWILDKISA